MLGIVDSIDTRTEIHVCCLCNRAVDSRPMSQLVSDYRVAAVIIFVIIIVIITHSTHPPIITYTRRDSTNGQRPFHYGIIYKKNLNTTIK